MSEKTPTPETVVKEELTEMNLMKKMMDEYRDDRFPNLFWPIVWRYRHVYEAGFIGGWRIALRAKKYGLIK